MKKFFFLMALLAMPVTAQETPQPEIALPEITPPSPTVANLMAFEEIPIDYYTGQPNISIPLCSKKLNGSLGMNVALSYHTSGVKVNNISGWTGTGWSLTAGGSISRTVRGIPDEFKKGSDSPNKTGVLHNDDFWNYDALTAAEKGEFNWNVEGTPFDTYDSQIDLYQFNFLGVSGRFIIAINNGVSEVKLLTRNQNIKIVPSFDGSKKINSFTITDAYGNKYLFNVKEDANSAPFSGYIPQGNTGGGPIPASGATQDYTNDTAWHLKTIATSNDIVLATFNYTAVTENYEASFTRKTNTQSTHVPYEWTQNEYNQGLMKPLVEISSLGITANTKKLSNVIFKDGTELDFISASGHPEMNPGTGSTLSTIIIKNADGSEDKRYDMVYETTDRLWLDKVLEKAEGITHTYDLSYTNKEDLTPKSAALNHTEADDWGYNTGFNNGGQCSFNGGYDNNAIKAGLLSSIVYPTNGRKEFEFEAHTFAYQGDSLLSQNDFLKFNPNNATATLISHSYDIVKTGSTQIPFVTLEPFSISYDQDVFLSNSLSNSTGDALERCFLTIYDQNNGNGLIYSQNLTVVGCSPVSLPAGDYLFGVAIIDPLTTDSYSTSGSADLTIANQNIGSQFKDEALGGGVRIKEIRFNDLATLGNPERVTSYTYNEPDFPNRSSGSVDAKIGNLTQDYNIDVTKYLFRSAGNLHYFPTIIRYRVKAEESSTAQLTKGGYVGYKHVTMQETGNGKTSFTYTSPIDFPSPVTAFRYPYFSPPNLDYKRGLLLKQRVEDNSGKLLKETENIAYNYINEIMAPSFRVYYPDNCEWKQFFDTYDMNIDISPNPDKIPFCGAFPCVIVDDNCGSIPVFAVKDNVASGWAQLKESISKEYFYEGANQKVVETRQTFDYNTQNFQQSIVERFTKENGIEEHYKTELFYPVGGTPANYEGDPLVTAKMLSLNMINLPLYTQSSLDGQVLSNSQNIYEEFSTDKVDLKEVKTEKTNLGIDERMVYEAFDTHGNPLEVSMADGPPISYVWGHGKTLPVAAVQNATSAEVTAVLNGISGLSLYFNGLTLLQADELRAGLPNAMVTTYTYDLLVGVTSVTDPRGYTMYYEYDEFNRLQYVRDADNNLISENQYNYKNQN